LILSLLISPDLGEENPETEPVDVAV
jgi:hypothetical protein